jgi:DNA-binding transcriptional MerR regulator
MEGNGQYESAPPAKNLFRIGEVSRLTSTKQFVLRYWETEFPMLQPVKSPKGHRLYRRQDIETVFQIKRLLYDEGFTIAGARRHLREQNSSNGGAATTGAGSTGSGLYLKPAGIGSPPEKGGGAHPSLTLNRKTLLDLRDSLRSFLTLLEPE